MSASEFKVTEGESTELECISFIPVKWIFSPQRKNLPDNTVVDVNLLKINNIRIGNAGRYECQGSSEDLEYFWVMSVVYVSCKAFSWLP